METAYLRPRDPYSTAPYSPPGPGAGLGAAPVGAAIKHATFPRSARAERAAGREGTSPSAASKKQPSCDCCPYGYHIDLDFVRFCERLAGAGGRAGGSPTQAATKARRRERRRQRQSMDVLLGLVAPPEQPQVWTIEQTLPQMPPSPVSLPPHASILVRDALQRAVRDFEETLERSTPAPPSTPAFQTSTFQSSAFQTTVFQSASLQATTPPPVPPRLPPRRQSERTPTSTPVNARYLEQALDSGLWAAACGSATPALQSIRQQMARSLERMRELEEEVKMIPVLQVQLSVLQEEKRKMLLHMKNSQQSVIKQNGVAHLDVLKIEEPVRGAARPTTLEYSVPVNGSVGTVNGPVNGCSHSPKRRQVRPPTTRDIGVGCTVLTRDVGLMPPPPRLRTVATCTDPLTPPAPAPSPAPSHAPQPTPKPAPKPTPCLSLSSVWREDIPQVIPVTTLTSSRGVQTDAPSPAPLRSARGSQTEPLPPPPAPPPAPPLPPPRPECREAGVQVQPPTVHRSHVGIQARPHTSEVALSCVPKTKDAASSDCTVDDILCAKCNVRKRSVAVETTFPREEDAAKRVCLSALSEATATPSPTPAPAPPPPPSKPRTRTVGCGTAGDRINPFSVHRAVNTDPPLPPAVVNRAVNTDAAATTMSRATHVDLRTATACRATNTDVPAARKDVATATATRKLVDAAVSCNVSTFPDLHRSGDKSAPVNNMGAEAAGPSPSPSPCPATTPASPATTPGSAPGSAPGQSRIPRLSTAPQGPATTTATPPPRQFKRQDTYTKEPAPVVDITNKSPPPRRSVDTASRKLSESSRRQAAALPESEDEENEENAQSEEQHFKPIRNEPRIKSEPSKEMRAALKVLDDHLQKKQPLPAGTVPQELRNAFSIVQLEWFKVSSTKSADPLEVEDYLDFFEDKSTRLLEYVINMTDHSGNTAMHYAVSHGNFDVVSVLLDSKVCNVDVMNTAGYTCVMLVSLAQIRTETHRHVVRRLFHLSDVNTRAKQHGQTALMLAVSHGRLDTVRLLLEAGADVNIQDEDGSTALMCAAEHGHLDIIKLLLAQPDCDVTVVDHDGSTALSIAMEAGNRDIGVLLYAQEHFSRGSSPYNSLKGRRARSVTPTGAALRPPSTPPPHRKTCPAAALAAPSATPSAAPKNKP